MQYLLTNVKISLWEAAYVHISHICVNGIAAHIRVLHNLKVHTRTLFYAKKEMHQVCKSVPVGAACKVTTGIFLHFFCIFFTTNQ